MQEHYEAIRILLLSGLAFCVAVAMTPIILRLLEKYRIGKQIRSYLAPLHGAKAGTPTMGGLVIWCTVVGLAFLFFYSK